MQSPALPHALFALFALLIVLASLGVVLARNPIRSTFLLIFSFLPTAGIYVLLQAPFVGILQVLVYAGAIMMLFTFVIMMINPKPDSGELGNDSVSGASRFRPLHWGPLISLIAAGFVLIPMVRSAVSGMPPREPPAESFGQLGSMARLMYENPAENPLTVSFELISFLILIGIIAALNYSRRGAKGTP